MRLVLPSLLVSFGRSLGRCASLIPCALLVTFKEHEHEKSF